MIDALAARPFVAYAADAPSGLVGTLGVRVIDTAGNVVLARSTANIIELLSSSGIYKWSCAGIAQPGEYLIVWDTDNGEPRFAEEQLSVTAIPVELVSPGRPLPDIDGFADAQEQKRLLLGSDVIFLAAPIPTWPGGTAINPDSGEPYDPTVEPISVAQTQTTVRCGVFFKAVNRGGAAQAALGSPAGWDERTRIFAIAPLAAREVVMAAVEFVFHDDHFKIDVVKDDETIGSYRRVLVYASAMAQ